MSSTTVRKILCPHCRNLLEYDPDQAGNAVDCRACGKAFRMPRPPGEPEQPEPAPVPAAQQEEQPGPIQDEEIGEVSTPSQQPSVIPTPPPIPLELLRPDAPLGEEVSLESRPPDSEAPENGRRQQGLERNKDLEKEGSGRPVRRTRDRPAPSQEAKKRGWMQTGAGLGLVQMGWFALTAGFWLWFLLLLSAIWSDRIVGQQAMSLLQWIRESTLSSLVILPAFFMIVGYVLVAIGQVMCCWLPIPNGRQATSVAVVLWLLVFLLFAIAAGSSLASSAIPARAGAPTQTLFGWVLTLLGLAMVSQLLFISAIWQTGGSLKSKKISKVCGVSLILSIVWGTLLVVLFMPGQLSQGLAIIDALTASRTPSVLILMGWTVILLSWVNFFIFQWILSKSRTLIRAKTSEEDEGKGENKGAGNKE